MTEPSRRCATTSLQSTAPAVYVSIAATSLCRWLRLEAPATRWSYTANPVSARAHLYWPRQQPNATQAVCINLRHLPNTTVEFESLLGCPLALLLAELSAPERLLVIDAADAVAEGMLEQLRYLVAAARTASLGVVAISATDNKQVVRDIIADCFRADPASWS